jgi:hypothetical protein
VAAAWWRRKEVAVDRNYIIPLVLLVILVIVLMQLL